MNILWIIHLSIQVSVAGKKVSALKVWTVNAKQKIAGHDVWTDMRKRVTDGRRHDVWEDMRKRVTDGRRHYVWEETDMMYGKGTSIIWGRG